MTEPSNTPTPGASPSAAGPPGKVSASDWAIAILLSVLIGLSAASLLGATFMELLFDKTSAWIRFIILFPVLIISTILLVKKWRKLFRRHEAARR